MLNSSGKNNLRTFSSLWKEVLTPTGMLHRVLLNVYFAVRLQFFILFFSAGI